MQTDLPLQGDSLERRLVELETRLAFQEHAMGELSDALAEARSRTSVLRCCSGRWSRSWARCARRCTTAPWMNHRHRIIDRLGARQFPTKDR